MDIILASKSPRRQELLKNMGLEFTVCPSDAEEPAPEGDAPGAAVRGIAAAKARDVAAKHPESLVIGADTLVYLNGRALGKPKNEKDAKDMLRALSGHRHTVYTGVCMIANGVEQTAFAAADVYFKHLTEGEIAAYVASGEPMDKAGAYGIQGAGALLVEGVRGNFYNVMGLPIARLSRELKRLWGEEV